MKEHHTTFTTSQIEAIKRLINRKVVASIDEQKKIRDEIRDDYHFYFSDFSSKKGYTVADLNELIRLGTIKVVDGNNKPTSTPTVPKTASKPTPEIFDKIISSVHTKKSFASLVSDDTEILILGTMPGNRSLELGEYYAHSRNRFWKIIATITDNDIPATYEDKKNLLSKHKIGLWDVAKAADRKGSLDSNITDAVPNDLDEFLKTHKKIKVIGFNGNKSADLFAKFFSRQPNIVYHNLASTSPANTGINFEQICSEWKRILK
ncbi:MAG TPA: DNA-deoxyinosine glycosylase [Sphingobacteriaceae bacterium]|nr:DNA-deoxyinosine glycosylase [Sphingobacteriaceae bacterium]